MQEKNNQLQQCALCDEPITESNDSAEHIIPNAIGGWRTVAGLICMRCNNAKGRSWDATLAKQFGWLSVAAGVVRDRGELQPVPVKAASGKEYSMLPDGSLEPRRFQYSQKVEEKRTIVSFVARNMQEARKKVAELKKKYPAFDANKALREIKITSEPLREPLLITMPEGGPDVGRSVISTALAYAKQLGIDAAQCEAVLPFLRNREFLPTCYGWSYLQDIIPNRPTGAIFHCVSIFGDPASGKLLAYVEYFSYARWHILLSSEYIGPAICSTYAIDPSSSSEIALKVDWEKSMQSIERIINGEGYDNVNLTKALESVIPVLMDRSHSRTITRVSTAALQEAWDGLNLPRDAVLTKAALATLAQNIATRVSPYLLDHRSETHLEHKQPHTPDNGE